MKKEKHKGVFTMPKRFRVMKAALLSIPVLLVVVAIASFSGAKSNPVSPFTLEPGQIVRLEISPRMSNTTYVDDASFIKKVVDLFHETQLSLATADEILLHSGSDPGEITLDGNTYSRNIMIEFVLKPAQQDAETLQSIYLYGDFIVINNIYYTTMPPLTDQFIVILNDIHTQGKGKTAVEILQ
jgi:hypothetical protein